VEKTEKVTIDLNTYKRFRILSFEGNKNNNKYDLHKREDSSENKNNNTKEPKKRVNSFFRGERGRRKSVLESTASEPKESKEEEEDGMARCTKKMNPVIRRIIGLAMAIVSGFFYGTNFNPPTYVMQQGGTHSQNGLDYVFSHFCGIFVTSTFFVIVYCIVTRNSPTVYRRSLVPGLASGAIWAVAQVSWFIANDNLSLPISFPIITSGPAVVATLWGVILFHEVTGLKHIILLIIALLVTIVGVALITLSKFISQASSQA